MNEYFLGVDPGRSKTGLAITDRSGRIHYLKVAQTADLKQELAECIQRFLPTAAIIGNGTNSSKVADVVQQVGPELPLSMIEEAHSTEEARKLYWEENPPRGWRRLVPLGLLVPDEPLDAYAAAVLLRRFLCR